MFIGFADNSLEGVSTEVPGRVKAVPRDALRRSVPFLSGRFLRSSNSHLIPGFQCSSEVSFSQESTGAVKAIRRETENNPNNSLLALSMWELQKMFVGFARISAKSSSKA